MTVYLLEVREELETWPECERRQRAWFTPGEAAAVVQEPELRDLLLQLQDGDRRHCLTPAKANSLVSRQHQDLGGGRQRCLRHDNHGLSCSLDGKVVANAVQKAIRACTG